MSCACPASQRTTCRPSWRCSGGPTWRSPCSSPTIAELLALQRTLGADDAVCRAPSPEGGPRSQRLAQLRVGVHNGPTHRRREVTALECDQRLLGCGPLDHF